MKAEDADAGEVEDADNTAIDLERERVARLLKRVVICQYRSCRWVKRWVR